MDSPYNRAYEAGIKLARLEWSSKYANPYDTPMSLNFQSRDIDIPRLEKDTAARQYKYDFDREAKAVQDYRDSRIAGEVNPTLDGIPVTNFYTNPPRGFQIPRYGAFQSHYKPEYSKDQATRYINLPKGPRSRRGLKNWDEDERRFTYQNRNNPQVQKEYKGNIGTKEDARESYIRKEHPVLSQEYTNPIQINHEYAHALGHRDEATADQYAAALGGYNMYDLADSFNNLDDGHGTGEEEWVTSSGHMSNPERMQMLAAPFAGPETPPAPKSIEDTPTASSTGGT
jgi:hypothetical protein